LSARNAGGEQSSSGFVTTMAEPAGRSEALRAMTPPYRRRLGADSSGSLSVTRRDGLVEDLLGLIEGLIRTQLDEHLVRVPNVADLDVVPSPSV